MRIALFATAAAALAAVPLAVSVAGPQMSGDQFLSAVRCTAYESVATPNADLGAVRMQLNAEARRQPAETASQARAEAKLIARQAVISESAGDAAMLRATQATACQGSQMATGAAASDAV